MKNLQELGSAVAALRKQRGFKQADLAAWAEVSHSGLRLFEVGEGNEFGTRKLLAVLELLGMELAIVPRSEGADTPRKPAVSGPKEKSAVFPPVERGG